MKIEHFIAKRIAFSKQKSFTHIIVRIAMVSVSISLAIMIISSALLSGFKKEITSKVFGFWGHIHITDINISRTFEPLAIKLDQKFYPHLDTLRKIEYMSNTDWMGNESGDEYYNKATNGGIRHIQAFAIAPAIIKTKDEIEGIILKGVDQRFDWSSFDKFLIEGLPISMNDSITSNELILSKYSANRMKLKVGDETIIHYIKGKAQIRRKFKIVGIYNTGLDEYDKRFAIADVKKVQNMLGWANDQVAGFEVFIDDIDDMEIINQYIYSEVLPPRLYSETIRSKFPTIFDWLALQDINEYVIMALMIIVAIINMITALIILILERTNMIRILKALGSRNWVVQKIFLMKAAYIILFGLFYGNLLGIGFCLLQDYFGFIQLDEASYYLSVAPVHLNVFTILLLNILCLSITLIFLIIPSFLITRISPLKAIKYA